MQKQVITVNLDKFNPRWYQVPIFDAIMSGECKRLLYIAARRAGKDILFWNLAFRQCLKRTCLVFYVLPTYSQGRKAIWDAIAIDGTKFLDYIPPEAVESINQSEMKIRFKNGSILQVIGGDTYDTSLVGTNPYAVILSEYSLMPPDIYSFIRPILAANGGWCAIVGTPRGKNHMWHLYKIAQELPEWKVVVHKASEIGHIPHHVLMQEKAQMDEGLYLQEYETSFERGISGSFYGVHLDNLRLKNQICHVAYEPGLLVYTAWDIGVNDATTIIFFQVVGDGTIIRIIDCYSNNNVGIDHYVHIIGQKPYNYGGHYAPHDIKVREWGGGAVTRYEKARQLGLTFKLVDDIPILDGIENVWTHFPKFWIDQEKCRSLIDALENYRKVWDDIHQVFLPKPAPKQWSAHFCFTADTEVLTRNGIRQIIDIDENDQILTLYGWESCTKSQLIQKNAELMEVAFSDGTKVKCTPDHLFLTDKDWKCAEHLQRGSKIQSYWMNSFNISKEKCTDCTETKDTFYHTNLDYTEMYGYLPMEKYQMDVIYITKTPILQTIQFITWCAYLKKTIGNYRDQIIKACQNLVERAQQNGTLQKKEGDGIYNKLIDVNLGKNGKENQENVNGVQKNLMHSSDQEEHLKNIAMPTAKQLRVENVIRLTERQDVYCIGVPGSGHFSLANGAIVKNCDALRYMCIAIHKTKKGLSPEEFERKKAQALYGGNRGDLPRFFDDSYDSNYYRKM